MKSVLVMSIIALLLTSAAHAAGTSTYQTEGYSSSSSNSTSLRLLGGLGFSTVNNKDMDHFKDLGVNVGSRTGLNLGLEIDLPISESFSFSTGANYIQKGVALSKTQSEGGFTVDAKYSMNLNYIEIPAMINGNLQIGSSTLGLGVGPYLAFAVSKSTSTYFSVNGVEQKVSDAEAQKDNDEFSKQVKSTDLGGRASLRFTTPISSDLSFVAGANYDLGLSNISESDKTDDVTKTRSFTANVGLGIFL